MTGTASSSSLWKDLLFSDVRLQLCTVQQSPDSEPASEAEEEEQGTSAPLVGRRRSSRLLADHGGSRAKAARRGEGSSTAPEAASAAAADGEAAAVPAAHSPPISVARTFSLHGSVLACASTYFKTRMAGSAGGGEGGGASMMAYADAGGVEAAAAGGGNPPRWLLIERMEEGELGAMEAVLRRCYTGLLCDEGETAAELSLGMLLKMIVLADRFDFPLCVAHCCEELAGRGAGEYDIPAVNLVFGGPLAAMHSHGAYAGTALVVALCTERLLGVLGDAEAVGGASHQPGSALHAQLHQLSQPSLVALLSSDRLKARSENSVLMVADAWASGPAGAACTDAQRRQVAEVLRLGQLTHTFTYDVLKALPWLQLSGAELDSLQLFAASGGAGAGGGASGGAARLAERRSRLVRNKQVVGPPAWYAAAKRVAWPRAAAGLLLCWDLTKDDLAAHLDRARALAPTKAVRYGPRSFYNGFVVAVSLCVSAGNATIGGRACVGHSVQVWRAGVHSGVDGGDKGVHCRDVESKVSVVVAGEESGPRELFAPSSHSCLSLQPSRVLDAQLLDVAGWGEYLLLGAAMCMQCTITSCT